MTSSLNWQIKRAYLFGKIAMYLFTSTNYASLLSSFSNTKTRRRNMTLTNVSDILDQRGQRYGKFTGHAEVTQMLKVVIQTALSKRNKTLAPDQQEALDMICHKIGRIVNGDPDYADSWIDIAGYAQLVADRLGGVER
jgi:hypothetical protein